MAKRQKKRPAKRVDGRSRKRTVAEREAISAKARERYRLKEEALLEEFKKDAEIQEKHGRRYAGDYLESLFKYTGVKALVDVLVDDCGCEDRKLALNSFHEDLSQRYNKKAVLDAIYNAYEGVFGEKVIPKVRKSQCAPCHKKKIKKLRHFFMRKKMEQGEE